MDNIEIRNEDYKVLVVDDIPDNVILLNAFLRRAKFRVVTASDGPQALSKVGSEHPDLMLLDIMMPGMDGFEVLRRASRPDPAGKDLPVIVVTALSGQDDIARAFECGASDFITKPILYQNLITRITHQLRYSAALKAVRSYSEQLSRTIETRDRMYSVIAHDLRSPIGTLKMTFELLLEQLPWTWSERMQGAFSWMASCLRADVPAAGQPAEVDKEPAWKSSACSRGHFAQGHDSLFF